MASLVKRTRVRFNYQGRFQILLVLLFALLLSIPVFQGHRLALFFVRFALTAVLFAGIYAVSHRRAHLIVAIAIAIPTTLGRWLPEYNSNIDWFATVTLLTALFLAYTGFVIISLVARSRVVTFDTISGAICGYLLVGMTFGFLYSVVEVLRAGAFNFQMGPAVRPGADFLMRSQLLSLIYFSFVTLTSTGFGDILPVAPIARTMAVLEAMVGQFYVAIFIARLVSLELLYSKSRSNPND